MDKLNEIYEDIEQISLYMEQLISLGLLLKDGLYHSPQEINNYLPVLDLFYGVLLKESKSIDYLSEKIKHGLA